MRVVAAGVCHSDVRYANGELGEGHWPIILGHEGAGVVEEVGEGVTHVEPGDHVAFCFVPACRACRYCLAGKPNLCEVVAEHGAKGMLMDGTSRLRLVDGTTLKHGLRTACFAERTVVAAGGAVPITPELPLWQAALLGCGVVTGMGAVRNSAGVEPGDSVAVLGCGGVGLQVVAAARIAGADPIIAVDRVAAKLELAAAQGATHLVDAAGGREARQHDPATHGRRRRLRVRGDRPAGDDAAGVGSDPAGRHRQSSSASPPWASRRACPRSSSSRTRRSAAPTTAPATRRRSSPGSRSSPSRASSTSPASSPTSTRWTGSRPRSTGSVAARARVPSW